MPTPDQILATLREQRALLSRRYPIHRLALFGSWARGDAREDSDVDVLVEVDPSIGLRFVELGDDSKKLWGAGWTGLAARDQTFALEADRARADRCLSRILG
ncbi:MAG TPA: nucleotidyltransferase domain-containing protein [Thermoanaerobaculia bacterium]|nr:nucleotidyltransferase domain-containing protein [Thermoanaerobaculia bacterium]